MSKFKRIMSFLLVVLMILPIFLSTGSVLAKEMTEKPVITQENPKKEKEEVVIVDKTKDKSGEKDKESPKEEPQEDKVTIVDSEEENKETEVKEDKKPEVKEVKKESKEEIQDIKKEEVKEDIKDKEIKDKLQTKSAKNSDSLMISENIVGQAVQGANDEVVTISDPKYFHIEDGVVMGFVRAEDDYLAYEEIRDVIKGRKFARIIIPSDGTIIGRAAFGYGGNIIEAIIPDSITKIESQAFYKSGLKQLNIPESATSIEEKAFADNQLTDVVIPASMTNIGEEAFAGNQLTSLVINNGSSLSIGDKAFYKNQLKNINIPRNVTNIGRYAFSGNRITDLTLSEGVKRIKFGAFEDNLLTKIEFPKSVIYLEGLAFSKNKISEVSYLNDNMRCNPGVYGIFSDSLDEITVKGNPEAVPDFMFSFCGLSKVNLPESITSIGEESFSNNNLTSFDIPKQVEKIGKSAFERNKLSSITIPESVQVIDNSAFLINELTSVFFEGTGDIFVGMSAFEHNKLSYIKVPKGFGLSDGSGKVVFRYNSPTGNAPFNIVKLFTEDFTRPYSEINGSPDDDINKELGGHIFLTKPQEIEVYKVDDTGKWNDKMRTSVFSLYGDKDIYEEDNQLEIFRQVISSIRIVLVKQPDGSYKNYNSGDVETLPNGNLKLHQTSQWIDVGTDESVANKIEAYNDWDNMKRYNINNKTGGLHTLKTGEDFERNIGSASQIDTQNIQVHKEQKNGKWWVRVEGDFIFNPDTMPKEDYLLDIVRLCKNEGIDAAKSHLNDLILTKYTMSEIKENPNYDYGAFLGLSGSKVDVIQEIQRLAKDPKFIADRENKEISFLYATTLLENKDVKDKKIPEVPYHYSNQQTPDEDGVIRFSISGKNAVSIREIQVPYGYEPAQESINLTPNEEGKIVFVNNRKDARYRIKYLEEGTNKELHTPKEGQGKYTEIVTEQALDIKGYKVVGNTSQTFELDDVDNIKEYIFYYKTSDEATKKTLTINYYIEGTTNPVPGISPNPVYRDDVKTGDIVQINHPTTNDYIVVEGQENTITIGNEINTVVNVYYKPVNKKTLTVNYYIEGTKTPVPGISPNPTYKDDVKKGDIIPIDHPTVDMYEIVENQDNQVTIRDKQNTVVNIYYRPIKQTLTINYYQKGTTLPVPGITPSSQTSNVKEGDHITIDFPKANNGFVPVVGQDKEIIIGKDKNTIVNIYYEKEETLQYIVQYYLTENGKTNPVFADLKEISSLNPFVKNVEISIDEIFEGYPEDIKNKIRFVKIDQQLPFKVTRENNIIKVYYEISQENQGKNILVKKIDDNNTPLAGATISIYKKLEGDQSYERYIKEKPIQSIETKDNGLALFENVDSDIVILETKSVEGFNLNREVKSVNIASYNGEEIIIKNHKITTKLPKTGSLGILPYILVSGLSVGFFIGLRKNEED